MANQTKKAILEKAFHLFASNGFETTSMNDIAAEVGVTKPTIYIYFKGKDDLVLSLLDQVQNDYQAYMKKVIKDLDRINDPQNRLYHLFERYISYFSEHKLLSAFWLRIIFFPPPSLRPKLANHMVQTEACFIARLKSELEEGMQKGVVRQGEAADMALSFYAMREGVLMLSAHKLENPGIKAMWRDYWLGIGATTDTQHR